MATFEHDQFTLDEPDLRNTPVLKGDIYCSPFCGGQCKKAAYDKAVSDSDLVAKTLGEGWNPRVYEKLGWHWKVSKGHVEVSLSGDVFYACFQFNANNSHYYYNATNKCPREAVEDVRNQLSAAIDSLTRQLASSALDPILLE